MSHFHFTNILLADDDLEDREFFEEALKEVHPDAVVTTSTNGVELMRLLNQAPQPSPDIIFLDLNMPLKDGFQCLEEIRKNEDTKDTAVVILTTSGIKEDIDRTYEKGANLFVTKPADYRALVTTIKKVLSLDWLDGSHQPEKEQYAITPAS